MQSPLLFSIFGALIFWDIWAVYADLIRADNYGIGSQVPKPTSLTSHYPPGGSGCGRWALGRDMERSNAVGEANHDSREVAERV